MRSTERMARIRTLQRLVTLLERAVANCEWPEAEIVANDACILAMSLQESTNGVQGIARGQKHVGPSDDTQKA